MSYEKHRKDIVEKAPFWATPDGNHQGIPGNGRATLGKLYAAPPPPAATALTGGGSFQIRTPAGLAAVAVTAPGPSAGGPFGGSGGAGTGGSQGGGRISNIF